MDQTWQSFCIMSFDAMSLHLAFLSKSCPTYFALKRFFLGMNSDMFSMMAFVTKNLEAIFTGEGRLFRGFFSGNG
jgi:hypothetical protein